MATVAEELSPAHDEVLRGYLAAHLDPHVGRASTAFRGYLRGDTQSPSAQTSEQSQRPFSYARFFTVAGSALAASLAFLFVLPMVSQQQPQPADPGSGPVFPSRTADAGIGPQAETGNPMHVQRAVSSSQAWDDGVVLHNGAPVRRFRVQQFERTRWEDRQRGIRGEHIAPRDNVVIVESPAN